MNWAVLAPFLVATLLVVMTPGPVMTIIAHNTLRHGTAAGLLTAIGVELGELCLLIVASAGVTISAELSPALFRWLALAGALYLVWLAASGLRSRYAAGPTSIAVRTRMPIVEGLTVALGNPVALVFYAAFFPQFLDPDRPAIRQTIVLGALYLCTALAFDLVWVLTLARIRVPVTWRRFASVLELGSAAVYLTIAIIGFVGFAKAWD
jgi:threonine/homoserine/homoserine lactone efflux protein